MLPLPLTIAVLRGQSLVSMKIDSGLQCSHPYKPGLCWSVLQSRSCKILVSIKMRFRFCRLAFAGCYLPITIAVYHQHEDAIQDYNAAIRINPDYVEAYYNRGLVKSEPRFRTMIKPRLAPGWRTVSLVKSELGPLKMRFRT